MNDGAQRPASHTATGSKHSELASSETTTAASTSVRTAVRAVGGQPVRGRGRRALRRFPDKSLGCCRPHETKSEQRRRPIASTKANTHVRRPSDTDNAGRVEKESWQERHEQGDRHQQEPDPDEEQDPVDVHPP